jgi:hypothetical protein
MATTGPFSGQLKGWAFSVPNGTNPGEQCFAGDPGELKVRRNQEHFNFL